MIELSAAQLILIRAAGERAYPEECCGLLVGRDMAGGRISVTRIVESENVRRDRAHDRFEIDPQVRIAVEREVRGSPERIVGHYHSHPDHPARPSQTDLEMVFEPNLIWLIVGVATGAAREVNAFKVNANGDGFDDIAIVSEDAR